MESAGISRNPYKESLRNPWESIGIPKESLGVGFCFGMYLKSLGVQARMDKKYVKKQDFMAALARLTRPVGIPRNSDGIPKESLGNPKEALRSLWRIPIDIPASVS